MLDTSVIQSEEKKRELSSYARISLALTTASIEGEKNMETQPLREQITKWNIEKGEQIGLANKLGPQSQVIVDQLATSMSYLDIAINQKGAEGKDGFVKNKVKIADCVKETEKLKEELRIMDSSQHEKLKDLVQDIDGHPGESKKEFLKEKATHIRNIIQQEDDKVQKLKEKTDQSLTDLSKVAQSSVVLYHSAYKSLNNTTGLPIPYSLADKTGTGLIKPPSSSTVSTKPSATGTEPPTPQ